MSIFKPDFKRASFLSRECVEVWYHNTLKVKMMIHNLVWIDVKKATTCLGTNDGPKLGFCLGTNDGPKLGFCEDNYRCNEIVNFFGKKSLEELRAEDYLIKGLLWWFMAIFKYHLPPLYGWNMPIQRKTLSN